MTQDRSRQEEGAHAHSFARAREALDLPRHLPYQIVHASSLLSVGFARLLQRRFRLVRREPAAQGRRRWIVGLTAEGAALHDQIAPVARMRARILQAALSPEEMRVLSAALARIIDKIAWLNDEERKDFAADPHGGSPRS